MRFLLIFLLMTIVGCTLVGQDKVNHKEMIGFGCYYSGQPTATVTRVTKLLDEKKYKDISDLLKNGNAGEKFLATISLEKLSALGHYVLSESEKELMQTLKSHGKKFQFVQDARTLTTCP